MTGEDATLPSYDSLAGVPRRVLFALLHAEATAVLDRSYEFVAEKDRALVEAIDRALRAAAAGVRDGEAARPQWLRGVVTRQLRVAAEAWHPWRPDDFMRVRLLERLGAIEVDADDTYVLAMVGQLGTDKAARLRADPELVHRALWRVFEVEGGGEISLTNVDRYERHPWRAAVLELVADGTLDRDRVLSACLSALGRDFSAYCAGWYSATYLALEPTADESASRQRELRRLTTATVPATVSFTLRQLTRVARSGQLDLEPTIDALPPATLVRAKGTALAALALARRGSAEFPESVAAVAHAALGHPQADVQRAAAALLADVGRGGDVVSAVDDLAPSVSRDLGLRLDIRVEARPAPGQHLEPAAPPVHASDLTERVAALLEGSSDHRELEAVLAYVATGADVDALVPVRKRARALVARGPETDLGDAWFPGQIARFVLALLGDRVRPARPQDPAQRFVVKRLLEARTQAAPLLATPDLPGGWLSPAAFVERLSLNPRPRHHDMVAALLRLHPDGREGLVATAPDLPPVARFALAGDLARDRSRGGPAAWWTAAKRSRAAYSDSEAPELSGKWWTNTWEERGRPRQREAVRFDVTTRGVDRPPDDEPTELPSRTESRFPYAGEKGRRPAASRARSREGWIHVLAAIWPHDAEHLLALTCLPVVDSPRDSDLHREIADTLDALSAHPGRMGRLAVATLAAGMAASHRADRLHAVDAFVELVPSGRIRVDDIAAVWAEYAPAWPVSRLAESLALSANAPGGAVVTMDLLTLLLPQLPAKQRGVNVLLDLLLDEVVRNGHRVSDPALVTWLSGVTGSSATARTARRLLG